MKLAPFLKLAGVFLVSTACEVQAAPSNQASAHWRHPGNVALENRGLFEGDIVLPGKSSGDRAAVTGKEELWTDGVVPYVIESRLTRYKKLIRDSMNEIENKTCVRFVERKREKDYVSLIRGSSCSSSVGRDGGPQTLSLGSGCFYKGTVLHELMHAIGFHHEHSRSDRDEHINVFTENIVPEDVEQFEKLEPWQNRLLSPFDRNSIMLYGSEAFARAPGLYTLLAKDGSKFTEPYDKKGLSTSDARRIRKLYGCSKKKNKSTK
ncbi:astacin-like metalloprotease toxin 5 [Haemaphysalis longicornis]